MCQAKVPSRNGYRRGLAEFFREQRPTWDYIKVMQADSSRKINRRPQGIHEVVTITSENPKRAAGPADPVCVCDGGMTASRPRGEREREGGLK